MSVVLVVVLSIVARSITDVAVSSREEEGVRAFSAAEAGIEQALFIGADASGVLSNANFSATVTEKGRSETVFNYPTALFSGESATFWFVDHNADKAVSCGSGMNCFNGSQIKICWGTPSASTGGTGHSSGGNQNPAIEISVVYKNAGNYLIYRDTADSYARTPANNFSAPTGKSCTIDGEAYLSYKTIDFASVGVPYTGNSLQYAKVRFFYNTTEAHKVGIDVSGSGSTLPLQGTKIDSVGQAGDANRKVEVFQTIGETPGIFDNVLFSGGGISQ